MCTENIVSGYGIETGRLRFEITERMIARRPEQICRVMQQMTKMGFGFYLDDFGTGYSNFASVAQFPFECIKLDKSLVQLMEQGERYTEMLRGLIELFHEMKISVLVEGTETRRQVESLALLGAERMQGFYYARPMPEEQLNRFFQTKRSF